MRTAQTLAVFALIGAATVPAFAFQEAPELPGTMDVSRVSGGTYETDPNHTLVAWTVNHFGFNDYFGAFGDVEGTLTIDPANPDDAMVDVSIPIDSVTVVSQGLHDHLLRAGKDGAEPDFFGPDAGMARFVSTDARFTGAGTNPMSKVETVGFMGTAKIMRSDFGIDYALPVVSDEVTLKISAAFEKR